MVRVAYFVLRCDAAAQPALRASVRELEEQAAGDARITHLDTWSGYPFAVEPTLSLDYVVIGGWSADEAALDQLTRAVDELDGAVERWNLIAEPVRVQGSLNGYVPEPLAAPLRDDEPAVIQIQGTLTDGGTAPFYEAGAAVVAQAFESPGYVGGIGFTETFAETISFSCWSSYRAARDYAFSSGTHNDARKRDRAERWHDPELDCFMRLRPLASTGSLLGRNPFEDLATVPS